MAMRRYALFSILVLSLFASSVRSEETAATTETKEFVLTLDHTNFTETINKHDFIVVEFYAPWYLIRNDSKRFPLLVAVIVLVRFAGDTEFLCRV